MLPLIIISYRDISGGGRRWLKRRDLSRCAGRGGLRHALADVLVRLRSMANFTRPTRSCTFNLRINPARYVSTVLGLISSRSAISLARNPLTRYENTSI